MFRVLAAAAAVLLLTAAAKIAPVEYRVGLAPPAIDVEIRLRGDTDGETRLVLPAGVTPSVKGANAAGGVLRHRPGAKLTVRYALSLRPDADLLLGESLFAYPQGRGFDPAAVRWGKLPTGWRLASDLDHAHSGRSLTVADVVDSVTLAGPEVNLVERPAPDWPLHVATRGPAPGPETLEAIAAARSYWKEAGPYLAVVEAAAAGQPTSAVSRGDGVVVRLAPADRTSRWAVVRAHAQALAAARAARVPAADDPSAWWFTEGVADFVTNRALARAGLEPPAESSARISDALSAFDLARITKPSARDFAARRGALLALKWDEDIRRKSAGKLDFDDVILRMRDHYARFPPGEGPNLSDSLVSAAWVTAGLDLRDDLQRYLVRNEAPPVPDTLFGGCLELRAGTRPLYDTGFDHAGSTAGKVVRGVARYGPAYASGVRNGMRLEAASIPADTSREVVLTVRDARGRGRPRTIRYWPYSDEHVDVRRLQLKPQMTAAELAACGRKLGGL
jgi:hypothetical protein